MSGHDPHRQRPKGGTEKKEKVNESKKTAVHVRSRFHERRDIHNDACTYDSVVSIMFVCYQAVNITIHVYSIQQLHVYCLRASAMRGGQLCECAGLFYYLDTAVYKIIHLLRVAIYMYAASTETQQ